MPSPGEYRPDPTEGTTRIEDLPRTKVTCQSRTHRRRPCPAAHTAPIQTAWHAAPSTTWATPSPDGPATSS